GTEPGHGPGRTPRRGRGDRLGRRRARTPRTGPGGGVAVLSSSSRIEASGRSASGTGISSRLKDLAAMDPKTLRFSPTHEWVHLDGDVATVGISQFAVEQLTDLIMIDLPAVGTKLSRGQSFGQIESVKSVNDLYAPVGGEVIEVNPA